jgi:DNA-directed RNA polymerase subunit M/transcription elongation factor TFIIS
MSYSVGDSEQHKVMKERSAMRVSIWESQQQPRQSNFCPVCNVRLIYQDKGTMLWCKECGNKTPVQEIKREKRLSSKYGYAYGSSGRLIKSMPRRGKKSNIQEFDSVNSQLDQEEKEALRAAGHQI